MIPILVIVLFVSYVISTIQTVTDKQIIYYIIKYKALCQAKARCQRFYLLASRLACQLAMPSSKRRPNPTESANTINSSTPGVI